MDDAITLGPAGLIAYDLAPPGPRGLIPVYRPFVDAFTPEGRAELARRRAENEAEAVRNRELLAAAHAEWEAARRRLEGNAAARAVLDIHRPDGSDSSGPFCTECREGGYSDAGDSVEWACRTYRAVTGEAG
jgi:hypothetical protein